MSNFEKASNLASEWIDSMGGLDNIHYIFGDDVSGLIQAFRDEGLLAPDLPRPTRDRLWQTSASELGSSTVHYAEDQVAIHTSGGRLHTHYKQARDLAMALLAACEYAEKEQRSEEHTSELQSL